MFWQQAESLEEELQLVTEKALRIPTNSIPHLAVACWLFECCYCRCSRPGSCHDVKVCSQEGGGMDTCGSTGEPAVPGLQTRCFYSRFMRIRAALAPSYHWVGHHVAHDAVSRPPRREAKAELTNAKRRLAAENDARPDRSFSAVFASRP